MRLSPAVAGATILAKLLYRYFIRGLLTALPLGLTVYFLYVFLRWSESVAIRLIRPFIGDYYFPGLGLALGISGIFLLGVLMSQRWVGRLVSLVELPFTNLPVVKSIYSSLKSFADYFSPQQPATGGQTVVILRLPDQPLELVGLVTRSSLAGLHVIGPNDLAFLVKGTTRKLKDKIAAAPTELMLYEMQIIGARDQSFPGVTAKPFTYEWPADHRQAMLKMEQAVFAEMRETR